MSNESKAYIHSATNILVHVPELVRYGSKCHREVEDSGESFLHALNKNLRSFKEVVSYPPNQAFIGNLNPDKLDKKSKPWFENLLEGSSKEGVFGEILDQTTFYMLLKSADDFELFLLDSDFINSNNNYSPSAKKIFNENFLNKGSKISAIEENIQLKGSLSIENKGELVGCFQSDHEKDESLDARILLENLSAKASGAFALNRVLVKDSINTLSGEYIISCSEEAIGDRYNRGGGNLAKAIGEMVGCKNASGMDVKAFCAAPVYALIHAASLIQSKVVKNVAVVGGGSLAKLGMKAHFHMEKKMPVLEDLLGGVAFFLSSDGTAGTPYINLEIVGHHPIGSSSSPQEMIDSLVYKPLDKANLSVFDIDKFCVELHNPEITVPAGAGDVPLVNYKTIAALGVMKEKLTKEGIQDFILDKGMPGFSPTQGHIPAGVPYLGYAIKALKEGSFKRAMVVAKGSLFLGRMTRSADGVSVVVQV